MATESTDASSENRANPQSIELSQGNERKNPIAEYFNSLQVNNDVQIVSPDVLEKRILATASVVTYPKTVDYSKIIDESSRVVFFGENHTELEPKLEIARSLGDLKEMGYTAIALEQVGTDKQDLLSRYLKFGDFDDRDELLAYLKKSWGYGDLVAWEYKELLESARYHKLAGVAMGTVFQGSDPVSETKFMIQNRDERLANPLLKYLGENPGKKVLAITGAVHASRTFSNNMVGILQAHGIHTQSVGLFGEEYNPPVDYVKAIRDVGLKNKRVMIPNPGAIVARFEVDIPVSFDYVVHVPHPDFSFFR